MDLHTLKAITMSRIKAQYPLKYESYKITCLALLQFTIFLGV
jgi:hypothetical protein